MNSATIYPLEDHVIYGEGYKTPDNLKTFERGALMSFNPGYAWIKKREAEGMAQDKRFSNTELSAERWYLRYMHADALLMAKEWEVEIAEYDGNKVPGYQNALEKMTYWLDVAMEYSRQLDILHRFTYTGSYDKD